MPGAVRCTSSVVAYFPPAVYNSVGSSSVLPQLVEAIGREKLSTVQFLRHGACRLTFKDDHLAESFMLSGLSFHGHRIRLADVEPRHRLVYLRDLPCEIPDSTVRAFLRPFDSVHSITCSEHDGFPGFFNGSRVIKMSIEKDIPPAVQLAGFECRVWYRRQPQMCPICGAPGHRAKECPYNGKCRRCRQPGHVARQCRNAWGGPAPRPASGAQAPPAPAAPAGARPVVDVAGSEGANASPPGDAPDTELVAEVEFVSASDGEGDSGDAEVIAEASANVIGSLNAPRATRARRGRRRKRKVPPSADADAAAKALKLPASEDMDSSQDGSRSSFKKSHQEVWEDKLSWEEIRAMKLRPWGPRVERTLPKPSVPLVPLGMQDSEMSVTPTPEPCGSPILFGTMASEMSAALTPEPRGTPVPSNVSSDGSDVAIMVVVPTPPEPDPVDLVCHLRGDPDAFSQMLESQEWSEGDYYKILDTLVSYK